MKKISLILCTFILVAAAFVSCKNDPTKMTNVTVKEYFFDRYIVTGTIKETFVETHNTNVTTTATTYTIKAPEGNTDKTINNGFVYYAEDKSAHGNIDPQVNLYAYNLCAAVNDAPSTYASSANIGSLSIGDTDIYDINGNYLTDLYTCCQISLVKYDGDYYYKSPSGLVKVEVEEDNLEEGKTFTITFTEKLVETDLQLSGSTDVDKEETTVEVNLTFTAQ